MMNGWSNGSNLVLNIIGSLVVLFSDVEKLFTEKKGSSLFLMIIKIGEKCTSM